MIIEAKSNDLLFKRKNMVYVQMHYPDRGFGARYDIVDTNGRYIYFTPKQAFELTQMVKKLDVNECLKDLRIELLLSLPDGIKNLMTFNTDDIYFKCDKISPKSKESLLAQTYNCIKNMRAGKCPYDLARMLFPNAYKTKVKE